jgi:hypothetical protein
MQRTVRHRTSVRRSAACPASSEGLHPVSTCVSVCRLGEVVVKAHV